MMAPDRNHLATVRGSFQKTGLLLEQSLSPRWSYTCLLLNRARGRVSRCSHVFILTFANNFQGFEWLIVSHLLTFYKEKRKQLNCCFLLWIAESCLGEISNLDVYEKTDLQGGFVLRANSFTWVGCSWPSTVCPILLSALEPAHHAPFVLSSQGTVL